jgi:zeaxanthin glucosyltransferase
MKLGFICLNAPGHINPMTTLARKLQARNHEVVFLYQSEAAGLPCVSGPENDQFLGKRREVSKMQGDAALEFSMGAIMAQTEMILESLPAMVEENGVDALIIDNIQFYAELGAKHLSLPYIQVAAALHFDFSGYTPLSIYGWPHETTAEALDRNHEGIATFTRLLKANGAGVRAYAKSVGLEIDWDDPSFTVSPLASITQVPKAFDFESPFWPRQFHHTGPFHDVESRPKVEFPWERLTGEPMVYASMGTILNGRVDVFRTIVAALGKHKDLQLVLSVGDQIDPAQIGLVPSNAIIVKRAPQLELLKQASVCITHAGLNTVLESLAQRVPQIAIPVTYDQPGVAARIANKRTGVVTSLDKLTADHLSMLLNVVLHDPLYRYKARQIQKAIAEANGISVAADLIEESLGSGQEGRRALADSPNRSHSKH